MGMVKEAFRILLGWNVLDRVGNIRRADLG